ncbi:electron transfer flavoprotein, beta subunit [Fulvimarina pelagi HTCC2506]|uniref:Electron transfer flavoprotein, beta subunit n=2 Tax=Fulvimarina pelagi TaxID=217511 RepID=Q0FZC2_9HYPH|nr:electron transfer flavoprotein subunit beta [Fulvimarina pelagi]EAU40356.1 electron transfer flavoprotein, beta subunit [Fulvimarina pelagi HTCC2506]BAT31393.1 electron transfer flavoprotein, beta subunit [Fulvimarina pelagi]
MKTAVLLSTSRHPVSGRPALARLESQAIGLATRLGGEIVGIHAGERTDATREALGVGLTSVECLEMPADADPVPALIERLQAEKFDLVLAGRRGQGGLDTGLVPYLIAKALDRPIIADAAAIEAGSEAGTIRVDQALKKGARRRITVRLPAIVTVHSLAPAPAVFAYGASRRGEIRSLAVAEHAQDAATWAERPYRNRPRLMRTAGVATGDASEKLHVQPDPQEAAKLILDYLERNGIRSF